MTTEAIAERAASSKATIYRGGLNKAAVLIEAFREAVTPELPFPDAACFRKDFQLQLRSFVNMLTGRRGRIFAAFLRATQNDAESPPPFSLAWLTPRRKVAKLALAKKMERGQLRPGLDLDVVLDLLYGPIYYRVLTGHAPLTVEYADQLAEAALDGLVQGKNALPAGLSPGFAAAKA